MNRSFISVIIALLLLGGTLHAQGTATIDGTVVDSSQAAVPAAHVTLTEADTGQTRTTATSPQGNFTFTDLRPGMYTLKVLSTGFKTWEQQNIVLTVDQHATLRPVLQVGGLNQSVNVTAAPPTCNNFLEFGFDTRRFTPNHRASA